PPATARGAAAAPARAPSHPAAPPPVAPAPPPVASPAPPGPGPGSDLGPVPPASTPVPPPPPALHPARPEPPSADELRARLDRLERKVTAAGENADPTALALLHKERLELKDARTSAARRKIDQYLDAWERQYLRR